jgi:hypothetical protein
VAQINTNDVTRFQQKIDFQVTGITTPKVVTYETSQYLGSPLSLKNNTQNTVVNFNKSDRFIGKTLPPLSVTDNTPLIDGNVSSIQYNKIETYINFDPNSETKQVTFDAPSNARYSALNLSLGDNTQIPRTVTIEAILPGSTVWRTILDKSRFQNQITFPEIQPNLLRITFETPHLLRLSELKWTTTTQQSEEKSQISFWAEEGDSFTLFIQPSFGQTPLYANSNTPTGIDSSTPTFSFPSAQANPSFNPDFDNDGLIDSQDLCPLFADSNNLDIDKNGRGDACEDPDQDGLNSNVDNCPFVNNRDQSDTDKDGEGDACDDTVDQVSENSELWINLSFGLMILALLALVGRSAWPAIKNKK